MLNAGPKDHYFLPTCYCKTLGVLKSSNPVNYLLVLKSLKSGINFMISAINWPPWPASNRPYLAAGGISSAQKIIINIWSIATEVGPVLAEPSFKMTGQGLTNSTHA